MFRRTQVISWDEWKAKKEKRQGANFTKAWTVEMGGLANMAAITMVQAASPGSKIAKAFTPIIDLVLGVAYPLCFLMLAGGFLIMMTGNRNQGLNMLKWAAIGYIGLQFTPAIMSILYEVGQAMRGNN